MSRDLVAPAGMDAVRFPAMGTEVAVTAPAGRIGEAAALVRDLFAEWDATLSRFRPGSELSRLNARAGTAVPVSALLYGVVDAALEAARATCGVFDPTLLHDLVRAGYDRTFALLPQDAPAAATPASGGGGWRAVLLDPEWLTVTVPAGVGIDLGGIAKGMAVDAALDLLVAELGLEAALVDAGGDLAVRGVPADGVWPVAIEDAPDAILPLERGALATSGGAGRRWLQGGVERHHVLDPWTGEPARSHLRSVTVAAGSCRQAEVAATASFVLGRDGAADFLASHDLAGLLVGDDGGRATAGRWPVGVAA